MLFVRCFCAAACLRAGSKCTRLHVDVTVRKMMTLQGKSLSQWPDVMQSRLGLSPSVRCHASRPPFRSMLCRAAAPPQAADLTTWLLENGGSIDGVELKYDYSNGVVRNRELKSTRVGAFVSPHSRGAQNTCFDNKSMLIRQYSVGMILIAVPAGYQARSWM